MERKGMHGGEISDRELSSSLTVFLQSKPTGATEVWLFSYGSLMWNPGIEVSATRAAFIDGWHRSFCIRTTASRGTSESPGLMLGLEEGGECGGVAHRLDGPDIVDRLLVVWRRELITADYVPVWAPIQGAQRQLIGTGIAFVANTLAPGYEKNLGPFRVAERIVLSKGSLGTCLEYFEGVVESLEALNIRDPNIEDIKIHVRTLASQKDEIAVTRTGL